MLLSHNFAKLIGDDVFLGLFYEDEGLLDGGAG